MLAEKHHILSSWVDRQMAFRGRLSSADPCGGCLAPLEMDQGHSRGIRPNDFHPSKCWSSKKQLGCSGGRGWLQISCNDFLSLSLFLWYFWWCLLLPKTNTKRKSSSSPKHHFSTRMTTHGWTEWSIKIRISYWKSMISSPPSFTRSFHWVWESLSLLLQSLGRVNHRLYPGIFMIMYWMYPPPSMPVTARIMKLF